MREYDQISPGYPLWIRPWSVLQKERLLNQRARASRRGTFGELHRAHSTEARLPEGLPSRPQMSGSITHTRLSCTDACGARRAACSSGYTTLGGEHLNHANQFLG